VLEVIYMGDILRAGCGRGQDDFVMKMRNTLGQTKLSAPARRSRSAGIRRMPARSIRCDHRPDQTRPSRRGNKTNKFNREICNEETRF
jgi:hypothetical protein